MRAKTTPAVAETATEATSAVTPDVDVPTEAPDTETEATSAATEKPVKPTPPPLVFDVFPVPEDLKHGGFRKKGHGNRKHFLWSMEIGGSVFVPESHTSFTGVCSAAKAISAKDAAYRFSVLQVDDGSRVWRVPVLTESELADALASSAEQPAPQAETGEDPAAAADAA